MKWRVSVSKLCVKFENNCSSNIFAMDESGNKVESTKAKKKSKTRRLSVTCKRRTSRKANENEAKEQEQMELDLDLHPNDKTPEHKQFKKRRTSRKTKECEPKAQQQMELELDLHPNDKTPEGKKFKKRKSSGKAEEYEPKEQEQMELDLVLQPNDKTPEHQKSKKRARKEISPTSAYATLISNNRALAVALEKAEMELCSAQLEKVGLNKKILSSHQRFLEKTSDLESQVQSLKQLAVGNTDRGAVVVCQRVLKLLHETSEEFLRGSNLLSDALHLVTSFLAPSKGHVTFPDILHHTPAHAAIDSMSPQVIIDHMTNSICTTPPPDEPSAMELTVSQSVIIETNDAVQIGLDKGHDHENGKKEKDSCLQLKQEIVYPTMDSGTRSMEIDEAQAVSGRKRRSCAGVSYAEPGLRSKLRRGDPFTDSSFVTNLSSEKNGKKKRASMRSSTLSLKKRQAHPTLTDVVILEES